MITPLILKRASASRSSGQWSDDDFDVLEGGVIVGRIFHLDAVAPEGRPWMWASGHSAGTVKRAAHGYEPTREAAMAAFAKSWRRQWVRVEDPSDGVFRNRGSQASSGSASYIVHIRRRAPGRRASGS